MLQACAGQRVCKVTPDPRAVSELQGQLGLLAPSARAGLQVRQVQLAYLVLLVLPGRLASRDPLDRKGQRVQQVYKVPPDLQVLVPPDL